MPKCDFNKVALRCNFTENALRHECSPVNLLRFVRTPFYKNFYERLFLSQVNQQLEKFLTQLFSPQLTRIHVKVNVEFFILPQIP